MILAPLPQNGCFARNPIFIYLNYSVFNSHFWASKGLFWLVTFFWELHVVLINTDKIKSESTTHNEAIILQAKNKNEKSN